MSQRLNMAVEHGAGATAAHRMPGAMHIQPFGGGFLAAADSIAHDWIKYLGAAAGDRAKASFAQSCQCIADRHAKNPLGQVADFDSGKSFDVKIGIKCAQLM